MTLNIYGQSKKGPEQKPERSWWWIGAVIVLVGLLIWLCGCATFEYEDAECKFKSTTLGKDIVVDPNGVMSTVSPKNQGIVEALLGGIAGFFIAGL